MEDVETEIQIEKPTIFNVVKLLKRIYPNKWTINKIKVSDDDNHLEEKEAYDVIILWNKIEVTNNNGQSHIIKDLYLKFRLDENLNIIDTLQGMRTTISPIEWYCGYRFSHLPKAISNNVYNPTFSNFCLGGGSELAIIVAELEVIEQFDENLFTIFLYILDNYVKWESLDGGPYMKMENINYTTSSTKTLDSGTVSRVIKLFIKHNILHNKNIPVKYDALTKQFIINPVDIEDHPVFLEYCDNVIKKSDFVYDNANTNIIDVLNKCTQQNIKYQQEPVLKFKDELVYCKIDISLIEESIINNNRKIVISQANSQMLAKKIANYITNINFFKEIDNCEFLKSTIK